MSPPSLPEEEEHPSSHPMSPAAATPEMDEVLSGMAETIKNFAVIYLVDITKVPNFNTTYELYDPPTLMFFFRDKHIMIGLGMGNNNKINWAMKHKQEFVDIMETVYRGARKGRGLAIAPKDYSTKYRYTESGATHDLFGPVTNKEVCFACSPVSVVVAQLASA